MFDPDDDELANKSGRQGEILFNDGVIVDQRNIAPENNLIADERQNTRHRSKEDKEQREMRLEEAKSHRLSM